MSQNQEFTEFLKAFAGCRYSQDFMYINDTYQVILKKSPDKVDEFMEGLVKFTACAKRDQSSKDDLAHCFHGIWYDYFEQAKVEFGKKMI